MMSRIAEVKSTKLFSLISIISLMANVSRLVTILFSIDIFSYYNKYRH